MPAPRVFVSSTFYDLRYIRENLKYFVKSLGYEPVLSEEGSIYYDPKAHVHEAAVAEVPSCQMLVLIIGGRYGQEYKLDPDQSVTNAEYKKAVEAKVPIFALVERDVYEQYHVYRGNKENPNVDAASINYPAVDSVKIFDFIEEVQDQAVNNALVPFADFGEIESYLRQQWASMMFSFLTSESEARRVADTLSAVTEVSRKIEFLTREVVKSVGDKAAKAAVEMYDIIIGSDLMEELTSSGARPTPGAVLKHKTIDKYFDAAGVDYIPADKADPSMFDNLVRSLSVVSPPKYDKVKREYRRLREELVKKIKEYGISVEDYLMREYRS